MNDVHYFWITVEDLVDPAQALRQDTADVLLAVGITQGTARPSREGQCRLGGAGARLGFLMVGTRGAGGRGEHPERRCS